MEAKSLDGTYLTTYWYTSTKLGKITQSTQTKFCWKLSIAATWGIETQVLSSGHVFQFQTTVIVGMRKLVITVDASD